MSVLQPGNFFLPEMLELQFLMGPRYIQSRYSVCMSILYKCIIYVVGWPARGLQNYSRSPHSRATRSVRAPLCVYYKDYPFAAPIASILSACV